MCLQGHYETGLQLRYLGLSLGFGSPLPPLLPSPRAMHAADPDANTNHLRRHNLLPHDCGPLVQIRADVQDFRVNREGSARCDGLLLMIVWVHLTVMIYTSTGEVSQSHDSPCKVPPIHPPIDLISANNPHLDSVNTRICLAHTISS